MNLRDLEYFAAVASLGSFSAAAKQCHVSQPTLSGQLRKLEEELGHLLFERTTRVVHLTDFGQEAVVLAREALDAVARLTDKAKARLDPFVGVLTLGAFPTLGPWLLPQISRPLHEAYPKLELYLVEEKSPVLFAKLHSGDLDAAFLAMPVEEPGLAAVPLFKEDFWLAIPADHPWRDRDVVALGELARQELLLLEDGHCLRDQTLDLCHRFGAREKGYFRATGLETLRQMIRMNLGMTLMPRLSIPEHEEPGIRYLPFTSDEAHRNIALCHRITHPRLVLFQHLTNTIRALAKTRLPVEPLGDSV